MRPSHTLLDGDTIFALSVGSVPSDISAVGALAAHVMGQAVLGAVRDATPLAGFMTVRDVARMRGK
jgi:L-aminopeptidase/D-esterase-like protein